MIAPVMLHFPKPPTSKAAEPFVKDTVPLIGSVPERIVNNKFQVIRGCSTGIEALRKHDIVRTACLFEFDNHSGGVALKQVGYRAERRGCKPGVSLIFSPSMGKAQWSPRPKRPSTGSP